MTLPNFLLCQLAFPKGRSFAGAQLHIDLDGVFLLGVQIICVAPEIHAGTCPEEAEFLLQTAVIFPTAESDHQSDSMPALT